MIAGAILERHLVKLCDARGLVPGNGISKRNIALRGAGLYGKAQGSQIDMWAHLRNAASHANLPEFDKEKDKVPGMIEDMKVFLEQHRS